MPQPQLQSVENAKLAIEDMLSAMLEPESPGYSKSSLDQTLRLSSLERSADGRTAKIVCRMMVTDSMANQMGNLHGGAAATITDNLTSMVLYLHTSAVSGEPWSYLGVSQSIQMLYFAPCPIGGWIDIECSSLTVGKSVAVLQCDIYTTDGEGGKRLKKTSTGTHTKIDNSSQAKL